MHPGTLCPHSVSTDQPWKTPRCRTHPPVSWKCSCLPLHHLGTRGDPELCKVKPPGLQAYPLLTPRPLDTESTRGTWWLQSWAGNGRWMVLESFCQGMAGKIFHFSTHVSLKTQSRVWLGPWSADWAPDVNWCSLPVPRAGKELPGLGPLQSWPGGSCTSLRGQHTGWRGRGHRRSEAKVCRRRPSQLMPLPTAGRLQGHT